MQDYQPLIYAVVAALIFIGTFVAVAAISSTRKWVKANSAAIGNLSQIASGMVAIIGFTVVILQLHDNRQKAAQESLRAELADARRLYSTYSSAALQYPRLTRPDYEELVRDRYEYERYETFVAHMLYAYDDILNAVTETSNQEALSEWKAALKMDVRLHQRYLCQEYHGELWAQYRPALKRYVLEAEGDCKGQKPLPNLPP